MLNTTAGPPVTRLGLVNTMVLNESNTTCLDYKYVKMVADMKNVSWDSETAKGMRQWTYQTCSEFGFYQTSEDKTDIFGDRFGVDFFIRQCMDVFSDKMDAKFLEQVVSQTNKHYGALHPQTTNVLYVHGSIDPWHALGLVKSTDTATPTIYIEGKRSALNKYRTYSKYLFPL